LSAYISACPDRGSGCHRCQTAVYGQFGIDQAGFRAELEVDIRGFPVDDARHGKIPYRKVAQAAQRRIGSVGCVGDPDAEFADSAARIYCPFQNVSRPDHPGARVIDQEEGFCRKAAIQAFSLLDPGDSVLRSCCVLAVVEADGINGKAVQRNLGRTDCARVLRAEIINHDKGVFYIEYGVGGEGAGDNAASVKGKLGNV
jgi:hypothetical protein